MIPSISKASWTAAEKTASSTEPPVAPADPTSYDSLTPEQRLEATEPLVRDMACSFANYERDRLYGQLYPMERNAESFDRLIVQGWNPLDNTESLDPAQQANLVGLLMGLYLNSEDPFVRISVVTSLNIIILNEAHHDLEISSTLKIKIISFLIDVLNRDAVPWLRMNAAIDLGNLALTTTLLDWQRDRIISAILETAQNKEEDPGVRFQAATILEDCLIDKISSGSNRIITDYFINVSQDDEEDVTLRLLAAGELIFQDEELVPLETKLLAADAICEISRDGEEIADPIFGLNNIIGNILNSNVRQEIKDRIIHNLIAYYQ